MIWWRVTAAVRAAAATTLPGLWSMAASLAGFVGISEGPARGPWRAGLSLLTLLPETPGFRCGAAAGGSVPPPIGLSQAPGKRRERHGERRRGGRGGEALCWPGAVTSGKREPEHCTLHQDLQDAPNRRAFCQGSARFLA